MLISWVVTCVDTIVSGEHTAFTFRASSLLFTYKFIAPNTNFVIVSSVRTQLSYGTCSISHSFETPCTLDLCPEGEVKGWIYVCV